MKNKIKHPRNNIKKLREKLDWSIYKLGEKVGASAAQINRYENRISGLSPERLLKISAALKVSPHEVIPLTLTRKFKATCDDMLVGEAIGWLLEAGEKLGVVLTHKQLSNIVPYFHKEVMAGPLNSKERKKLAYTIVQVLKFSVSK